MSDNEEVRLCGTCRKLLPISKFYKDGKTKDGKEKRRRNCIDCYAMQRFVLEKKKSTN